MRRTRFVYVCLGGLAAVAAGCGGSSAVTGPQARETAAPVVAGAAVVQGTVTGGAPGVQVGVVGTPLLTELDPEGQFVLSSVPPGTATLSFQGAGVDARLPVPGVRNGLVTSIQVRLSAGTAQLTTTPSCEPSAGAAFSGVLEQVAGTRLVVAGRTVDASQVQKVWRDGHRIPQLTDLKVGEMVKVWGTVRGDGTVVAEEIEARTPGGGQAKVHFHGVVDGVAAAALGVVHVDCTGNPGFVISGHEVRTNGATRFSWSDGSALSPGEIKVGDHAFVVGWNKGTHVLAEQITIDKR